MAGATGCGVSAGTGFGAGEMLAVELAARAGLEPCRSKAVASSTLPARQSSNTSSRGFMWRDIRSKHHGVNPQVAGSNQNRNRKDVAGENGGTFNIQRRTSKGVYTPFHWRFDVEC